MYLNKNIVILLILNVAFSINLCFINDISTDIVMKAHLCLVCNPSIYLSVHDILGSAFREQIETEVSVIRFEVHLSYIYTHLGINVFIVHLQSYMQY